MKVAAGVGVLPFEGQACEWQICSKMGGRSAEAYTLLKQAGFTRIKNLQGGILAWADQVDHTIPKY